jgi:hypothetical protein
MVDTGSTSQAVVQFLPDWLQSQQGAILRGGSVAIEFAPERLTGCRRNWRGAEVWDIEALARFHPRGEFVRGSLMERILTGGVVTALSPRRREIAVPSDTRQIEMWFHNFTEIGGRCDAWDSRFGENYWFDVAGPTPIEPPDPVRYRERAVPNPEFVNFLDQTAIKKNVFPAPPFGSRVGKDLRTSLNVRAWVFTQRARMGEEYRICQRGLDRRPRLRPRHNPRQSGDLWSALGGFREWCWGCVTASPASCRRPDQVAAHRNRDT